MNHNQKQNNKTNSSKNDGKVHSKHIKHDPTAESARAAFGLKNKTNQTD